MTELVRVLRHSGLLLAAISLAACGGKEGADYCLNHYLLHAEHQDSVTTLRVDVSDHGTLVATLSQPTGSFDGEFDSPDGFPDSLSDPGHVYSIPGRSDCVHSSPRVSGRDGVFVAEYESQCGRGAEIKRVNVTMLDAVPEIEEVEVMIKTPATSKHFAISRQCSAPIFRLDRR